MSFHISSPRLPLQCLTGQNEVLNVLSAAGYQARRNRDKVVLNRSTYRVSRHMYKLLHHLQEGKPDASLSIVERGIPCLLVMTSVGGQPWCVLVYKTMDRNRMMPKMFLLRHRFIDSSLFKGSVFEAVLLMTRRELQLVDVVMCFGKMVASQDTIQRQDILHRVFVVLHQPEPSLNLLTFTRPQRHNELDRSGFIALIANIKQTASEDQHIVVDVGKVTWLLLPN